MALKTPINGEKILPWAKEVTREINSLRPTGGNGVTVTRTNGGTTVSLNDSTIAYPDSAPPALAGELSGEGFATTYSLERSVQNAFSLFGFSNLSAKYEYSFKDLTALDLILRDLSSEYSILSSPTARYWNILNAFGTYLSGDPDTGDNPAARALSVIPDSEIDEPITYSIQHNFDNEAELELYKFHDSTYRTDFNPAEQAITQILIRKRGEREDGDGNTVSCHYLEYATLSSVLSAETDVYLFSAQLTEEGHLKVYFPSTSHVAYINGNEVHQDTNSQIVDGWNFFNQSDNAVYLNFYCDANSQDVANTYFAELGKWSWDLENAAGGQAGGQKVLMFSEMIAERVSDGEGGYILKQYRKGAVELGMPLGDADGLINGQPLGNNGVSRSIQQYQVPGDSGNHMALQLYDWHDANYQRINQSDVMKVFTNQYPRSSVAFMFKDGHDQGTTNAQLKYINAEELLSWTLPDSRIPNLMSRSLNAGVIPGQGEEDIGAMGVHLWNFYGGTNIEYTRQNGVIVARKVTDYSYPTSDIHTVSSYTDIVVRVRGHEGGSSIPEVSYIPLSALPLSGGKSITLDAEVDDIGRSLDLNSEDEAEIYGFEDADNHRTSEIHPERDDFILRYQQSSSRTPYVRYAKLSALASPLSSEFGLGGYTGDVKYVLSSTYSTSTHKFVNKVATMHFENGILKWNATTNLEDQEVYEAVPEEL